MPPAAHPLTPLLERMVRFGSSPPPFWARTTKSPLRRLELESVDRAVLLSVHAREFLTVLPLSGDVDLKSPIADSVAYTVPGYAGSVWIKSDHMGHVGKVASSKSSEAQAWVRWFFLLHEAAHCQFAQEPVRFVPSTDRLDATAVKALNDWQFGPLGHQGGPVGVVLNECFADTYAAMMLLEASHHAPGARQAIEDVIMFRRARRETCESIYAQSSELSDRQAFLGAHNTDGALRAMLDGVDEWKGLAPQQMRQRALQYASDAFLDWADPNRPQALGGHQGDRVWNSVKPDFISLMPALTIMASIHLAGGEAATYVQSVHGAHPAAPALLDLWKELAPQIDALPADRKAPLVAGLTRYTPGVDYDIRAMTRHCCGPCSPSLPSITIAQEKFDDAQRLIQGALAKAAPSVLPSMGAWRQLRATPSAPTPQVGCTLK